MGTVFFFLKLQSKMLFQESDRSHQASGFSPQTSTTSSEASHVKWFLNIFEDWSCHIIGWSFKAVGLEMKVKRNIRLTLDLFLETEKVDAASC